MGSRDEDPSAGAKRSHSSEENDPSPFVDKWEGYTWNQEARQWSYDGCNESHAPSCDEAKQPASPPFDGREPFTDDSGTRYTTPDERGHMPIHEVQNTKTARSVSPNPEKLQLEPKRDPSTEHLKKTSGSSHLSKKAD